MRLYIPIATRGVALIILTMSIGAIYGEEDPHSDEMTKWGPKLKKEELARIDALSKKELIAMLKTGDTLHSYAALHRLTRDDALNRNVDLLLAVAAETRGNMIVEGLISPVEVSASPDEKLLVDKFLDFLEKQLLLEKPSVRREQSLRSMVQAVRRRPTYTPDALARGARFQEPPPYASSRVLVTLFWCLDHLDWHTRMAAVRCLGVLAYNDFGTIDGIIRVLELQATKEARSAGKEETKLKLAEAVQDELKRLRARRPGKPSTMPGAPGRRRRQH
jgi:hypothetical protein